MSYSRESLKNFEEALESFANGEVIIVTDHHRREDEGDLIVAADKVTPAAINFMAKYGRGLICVALERRQLERLGLARMPVFGGRDPYNTAFMESVDASEGITTGISAHDRAATVKAMVDPQSTPSSVVRPGHVFPLEAVDGGVFTRAGHTEAAVDMARLCNLKPAGVICEIMREDGEMARGPELESFAKEHGIKLITIDEIANYRKIKEQVIDLDKSVGLPTPYGLFQINLFNSAIDRKEHLALVMGEPWKEDVPLVRLHSECLTGDVFGSMRCDCGPQLHEAMKIVGERGVGVILYMRQEGRGIGLSHKLGAYELQDKGLDTLDANTKLGFDPDMRDYCTAAQILKRLEIDNVELLTNNPSKVEGLEQYGITVAKRTSIVTDPNEHNQFYLETKKKRFGHIL